MPYAAQRTFGLQPQELIQSQEFFIPLLQRTFPVRRLRLFQERAFFPFGNHPDGKDGHFFNAQGLRPGPQAQTQPAGGLCAHGYLHDPPSYIRKVS